MTNTKDRHVWLTFTSVTFQPPLGVVEGYRQIAIRVLNSWREQSIAATLEGKGFRSVSWTLRVVDASTCHYFHYLCLQDILLLKADFFRWLRHRAWREKISIFRVVYFNQRMGAPHADRWLNSFVFAFKQVFCIFPSLTEKKKGKLYKNMQ